MTCPEPTCVIISRRSFNATINLAPSEITCTNLRRSTNKGDKDVTFNILFVIYLSRHPFVVLSFNTYKGERTNMVSMELKFINLISEAPLRCLSGGSLFTGLR